MSITPSKALLESLLPAKIRSVTPKHATTIARAQATGPAATVPATLKPDPVSQQGATRPMRRGSILDISV